MRVTPLLLLLTAACGGNIADSSYDKAAVIFDEMSLTPEYPEFLTLPLYEAMA